MGVGVMKVSYAIRKAPLGTNVFIKCCISVIAIKTDVNYWEDCTLL